MLMHAHMRVSIYCRDGNTGRWNRNLRFVQRFGFGIAEARRAMAANGNPPPEFQVEHSHVLATLRVAAAETRP